MNGSKTAKVDQGAGTDMKSHEVFTVVIIIAAGVALGNGLVAVINKMLMGLLT